MIIFFSFISDNVDENNKDILNTETTRCDTENESFQSATHLCNYKINDTVKKPFCDVCSKSFSTNQKLKQHMMIHTNIMPFKCEVCMKSFRQKWNFDVHTRVHTGEKPFRCDICGKYFSIKQKMKQHVITHFGEKLSQYKMSKKVLCRNMVNKPYQKHGAYKCFICDQILILPCTLKHHLLLHMEEKLFYCELCKRTFSQKWNFDIHMRVHTGEKPFQCDICFISFATKQKMKNHKRKIHNSE